MIFIQAICRNISNLEISNEEIFKYLQIEKYTNLNFTILYFSNYRMKKILNV